MKIVQEVWKIFQKVSGLIVVYDSSTVYNVGVFLNLALHTIVYNNWIHLFLSEWKIWHWNFSSYNISRFKFPITLLFITQFIKRTCFYINIECFSSFWLNFQELLSKHGLKQLLGGNRAQSYGCNSFILIKMTKDGLRLDNLSTW